MCSIIIVTWSCAMTHNSIVYVRIYLCKLLNDDLKSKDSSHKDRSGLRLIKVVFLSGKRLGSRFHLGMTRRSSAGNRSLPRKQRDAGKSVLSCEPAVLNFGKPVRGRRRHGESFFELH